MTQDSAKQGQTGYFYTAPGARNADVAINAAIKAAGAVAKIDNPAMVVLDSSAIYLISDHIWFTPNGNPGRSGGTAAAPAYPCSNIILAGRSGATIKLAGGLDLAGDWGSSDGGGADRIGMIYMYGASDVKLDNFSIDGSFDDLYEGKQSITYGQQRGDMVVLVRDTKNIKATNLTMFHGACDAFTINSSSNITVEDCTINWSGHDGWNCYNASNVIVKRCKVGIRCNSGFRWAGSGSGAEVCDCEFWTAKGGAAAFELQNSASNIKIHNNYMHNITGNGYGAIGYRGQSPSGSGHEYYDNLIIDCSYGISDNVPSSAKITGNVILGCSLTSRGTQSGNITNMSGHTVEKFGTEKAGNVYWKVDGRIVGIRPSGSSTIPTIPEPEDPVTPPVVEEQIEPPVLLMPANGAVIEYEAGDVIDFAWSDIDETEYNVQVSRSATFDSFSRNRTVAENAIELTFDPDATYFWRVKVGDVYSAVASFSTKSPTVVTPPVDNPVIEDPVDDPVTPPVVTLPVLQSPIGGATVELDDTGLVTFKWSDVGQSAYTFQASRSATFDTFSRNRTVNGTSATIFMSVDVTYYWRIGINGAFTAAEKFVTVAKPVVVVPPVEDPIEDPVTPPVDEPVVDSIPVTGVFKVNDDGTASITFDAATVLAMKNLLA